MRVAVTMPVWNQRPELLDAAVLSALSGLGPMESWEDKSGRVFIVDDGSDEPVVNKWGSMVTLARIEHGGVPAAFNRAMELIEADGEFDYVCRMGSDDELDADKIERQVAFMEALDADASFHDCRDSRTGRPYPTGLDKGGPSDRAMWRSRLRKSNRFYGGTSMIRASVLRGYRHPADLTYAQDWNLHCWVEKHSRGWEYLPRVLSTIGRYKHGLESAGYSDPLADVCRRRVAEQWSSL